eukprot:GGOE01059966.1.p1 GENE.GGOE01059966.1~~GGOE01059966.1.p1  ORF type:complete len:110 (+),score=1.94 GGOE01059966.1:34-363(+)
MDCDGWFIDCGYHATTHTTGRNTQMDREDGNSLASPFGILDTGTSSAPRIPTHAGPFLNVVKVMKEAMKRHTRLMSTQQHVHSCLTPVADMSARCLCLPHSTPSSHFIF